MMHSVYFCCCIYDSDIAPTVCVYRLFDLHIRSGFFYVVIITYTHKYAKTFIYCIECRGCMLLCTQSGIVGNFFFLLGD